MEKKDRTGETNTATSGEKMEIIKYIDYHHIIVRFEDDTEVETTYGCFKKGTVRNPNFLSQSRIGETNTATSGEKMEIIKYIDYRHIIVRFEDGTEVEASYYYFKKGMVRNPNHIPHVIQAQSRIGETNTATSGEKMTIIKYNDSAHIIVRFEDGTEVETKYSCFKNGMVRNPNHIPHIIKAQSRIGETNTATSGEKMTIIKYMDSCHIIVRFENGTEVETTYGSFKSGTVRNPNFFSQSRIGETNIARNGQKMEIIKYIDTRHIIVRFEDGTEVEATYGCFKKGTVRNPRFPAQGKGQYKNFQTEYAYTTPQGEVYFYCECQKCGWKKNMTPQEAVALDHICDLFEVKELLTSRYSKEQGVS